MNLFWRRAVQGAALVAMIAALLSWNISRFLGARAVIREKDLSFLPSPEMAQLMSMGQASALAKLRWIDSFAYFQYELDHKDDHVANGASGGVERLYDTLITLDPNFLPYYQHAALNASGVLSQHTLALSFLMRGLEHMPHARELWINAAAILHVYFHWDAVPASMASFLRSWQDAEETEGGKMAVLMWAASLSKRQGQDKALEQVSYWFDQLHASKAGSPTGDFIENNLRLHIARYALAQLQALVDGYSQLHGGATAGGLAVPQALRLPGTAFGPGGPTPGLPHQLTDVLDLSVLRHVYPHGVPAWGAVVIADGAVALRDDPYGHPWRYDDGMVSSVGLFRLDFEQRLSRTNSTLLAAVKSAGSWPADVAGIQSLGVTLPTPMPPPGGTVTLVDHVLEVHWDQPRGHPWQLR